MLNKTENTQTYMTKRLFIPMTNLINSRKLEKQQNETNNWKVDERWCVMNDLKLKSFRSKINKQGY